MMSRADIAYHAQEAAKKAAAEKKVPYVPFNGEELQHYPPFPFPNLGTYKPVGWQEIDYEKHQLEPLFVDKTGFGSPHEPALTIGQLVQKLAELYLKNESWGYAIIEEGQFQLTIGIFERTKVDPDTNLKDQLRLAEKILKDYEDPDGNGVDQEEANSLAELVVALNGWIKNGGFLPKEWKNAGK